jgi:translation initiation factor 1 (eIF-1/SUI1)
LEDLSTTGVFLSLLESELPDLQVETEVGIEMELPESTGQFRSTGKVVGYKPDEKKKDRVLVAIKLGETSEIDMERLAAILKKKK